ncbi:MAG: FecR family protein [Pseudobacter sp.]|uniref:FecR family protein n=1 Tax=Pseudobacter sp. TaxID=2045420 RepID=UPI003F7E671A
MNASSPDPLRIAALLEKQLYQNLSEQELNELNSWAAGREDHLQLLSELNDPSLLLNNAAALSRFNEEQALQRFLEKQDTIDPADIEQPARRIPIWRWAAAAAALIIIAAGSYFLVTEKPQQPEQTAAIKPLDIEPGKKGAVLILANGSQVSLDSLKNGLVATQSGMNAILQNGELVYAPGKEPVGEMVYNTISVPNGRVFQLSLPDGSKAWINSGSSIRYPVTFTGNQRQVEITGEAFFDVVKNRKMPFRVRVYNKAEVEVLGTQFNVNAYENEEAISTTLLEGSVKVSASNAGRTGETIQQLLTPGQQLQITEKGMSITEPDIDKVIAWKNGLFNFEGMELKQVMKQIARWYDVEIVYRGKAPEGKFYGKISRDISLAGLIKGFEGSGVHMVIENERQLVVMP